MENNETDFQFCKMKRILWLDGGDGNTMKYLMSLKLHLKMVKRVH